MKDKVRSEIEIENVEFSAGLLRISTAVKNSPNARLEIRRLFEPDAGNWLHAANDVIGEASLRVSQLGYDGLVILVDDLDKMILRSHNSAGCGTGEYLFVHRAAQLSAFQCHLVYSMPISLAYSHLESTIKSLYGGHVPVVPMTKVATAPPKPRPYKPGIERMRELICVRLVDAGAKESDLFAEARFGDELIKLCGGQPRELMTLVRESIVTKGLPIDRASLKRAQSEGCKDFARVLRQEHYPILARVARSGDPGRSEKTEALIRELLDMRAILQYCNENEWYGVNPQIGPLPGRTRSGGKSSR
jgi:hypothetical protein